MAICGIRELNKNTKRVIEQLVESREPVILTRQGQPIAAIMPLDQSRINDLVVSSAPEFLESMRDAERQLEAGETRPYDDVVAEIRAARAGTEEPQRAPAQHSHGRRRSLLQAAMTGALAGQSAGAGALGVGMSAAVHAALEARARKISEEIVEEATEQGVLDPSRGSDEPEPLDAIAETNMHLYSAALAAEHLRAVEATLREPEAAPPELSEIADSASSLVRNVNRCVLQRDRGIMSMAEYARCLADATAGTDDESLISELLETEAR